MFYVLLMINGAKKMHNNMFSSIIRSKMHFFESTPTGRILNRFSRDIDATERGIPESLRKLLRCATQVLSTLVVISTVTPWFMLTMLPLFVVYFFIRRYFIASMRQLKRMDSASKSPIFSHFSESLTGVSSIRAYKAQAMFVKSMEERVDKNLMFYYPNNIANRWLGLRLDMIKNFVIVFATFFAVLERSTVNTGLAALSITYSLNVRFLLLLLWLFIAIIGNILNPKL